MRRDVCKELGIQMKLKDDAFLTIDAANEAESTTDPYKRKQSTNESG